MSDLESRLSALSQDERQRLERALLARRRGGTAAARAVSIEPRDRTVPAVLSSAQRRLWFFDRLTPGSTTYNAIVAMWLHGPVDVDVLAEAVAATVARHEVLHSVIKVEDDEPVQVVLDSWEFAVERLVAEGADPDARRRHALELAAEVAGRPYDLAEDLTVRACVVETAPEECLFVLAEHHISFDGWSDEIAFREISEHYAAVVAGRPAPDLPAPAIQYADYAVWQRARIDRGELAGQVDYWRRQLAGAPAVAALPLDRERPVPQQFDGAHLDVDLAHAAAVRDFRVAAGATDFMVLVAAWAATLYRWSGEGDLVLGTPMANRNLVEVESLVGFFSNTVPIRVRVDGSASFSQLVGHVREVALAAFEHQDLPFELIVEAVSPERVPGANPLFQVNVRVQSGPLPRLDLPGVRVEPVHVDLGFSRFDLAIELQMEQDRIGGYLEFNKAVLDQATAEELLVRLDQLLGAALADPDLPVWELPQPSGGPRRRTRRQAVVPSLAPARRSVRARLPGPGQVASPEADVQLHWLDLSEPVDESALSPRERQRAVAFRFERDRLWFTRRRAHLRRILAEVTNEPAAALRYAVNDHDRPHLPDHPAVRFSTSSSGPLGLVAVSAHELGVDVERLQPHDADRDVAQRLFSAEEVAALEAAAPEEFVAWFFNCWTRKEAYVKATGMGLSFPLTSFAVEVHDTTAPRLLRSTLRPHDLVESSVRSLAVPVGEAAAALVVAHPDPTISSSG